MFYTIKNDKIALTVNSCGAEITHLVHEGVERIWQNDNGSWDGHAFTLFPVCGHSTVVIDGKDYNMPPHGFVYHAEWTLFDNKEDSLTFMIASSEDTKKVYPFDFEYYVTYKISGDTLYITHEMKNTSNDKPLYFGCGGHESFNVKEDLKNYGIEFEVEETPTWYQEDDIFVYVEKNSHVYDRVKYFDFPTDYISGERTLIFGDIKSEKLYLKKNDGQILAEIGFKGFSNMLFWRPEGSKMICIEPWINMPDMKGEETKEFSAKKGYIKVAPKESAILNRYVKYYKEK